MRIIMQKILRRNKNHKEFKAVGKNLIIDADCFFANPELMTIGDNVYFGKSAFVSSEMTIGNNIMIGPRATFIGGNHIFAIKGKSVRFLHPKERENGEPISIEDEVWCGAQVVVLGNVVLGIGCVIGAGSVVVKKIPPFTIAVGNGCRPVRKIFSDVVLEEHLLQLGYPAGFSQMIVQRRTRELAAWGLNDLPVVDNTAHYWEFREITRHEDAVP
jgi:acetyltransferase-like isoleucine patch superfamily enzyme